MPDNLKKRKNMLQTYIVNQSSFSSWLFVGDTGVGNKDIVHSRRVHSRVGPGPVRNMTESAVGSPETTSSWWRGSQLL